MSPVFDHGCHDHRPRRTFQKTEGNLEGMKIFVFWGCQTAYNGAQDHPLKGESGCGAKSRAKTGVVKIIDYHFTKDTG